LLFHDLMAGEVDAPRRPDVCVVGAGAAGVTLALELKALGLSVLLLESGGASDEAATQALYEGVSVGHPMTLDEGRYRVLGGSTTRWTGRCAKLDKVDLERRDWVPESGWPLSFEDIDAHYARAAEICGFEAPWRESSLVLRELDTPDLDTRRIAPFLWRYAPNGRRSYRNFGDLARPAAGIDIVLHANLAEIRANRSGRVTSVIASSLAGRRLEVSAAAFVLCCGGIENARLLLLAQETHGEGFGGEAVGRYFMQHPRGKIASVETSADGALALQDMFNVLARPSPPQYEVGFALPESVQREEKLLNASAILTYHADPRSGWERLKSGLAGAGAQAVRDLAASVADPLDVMRNLRRRASGRHPALRTEAIDVVIDLEQEPDPESRITLSDNRDALGMKRVRIDWRISENERRTAARFADHLSTEFTRLGLGALRPANWLERGDMKTGALTGTYHHIATTRMSIDPRYGAVDPNCRVHGAENLYVAGCSTFATGGHANPTLTIVALALRLAHHLAQSMNTGSVRRAETVA
jgi:choline dehydrogenase-like flavoprotein